MNAHSHPPQIRIQQPKNSPPLHVNMEGRFIFVLCSAPVWEDDLNVILTPPPLRSHFLYAEFKCRRKSEGNFEFNSQVDVVWAIWHGTVCSWVSVPTWRQTSCFLKVKQTNKQTNKSLQFYVTNMTPSKPSEGIKGEHLKTENDEPIFFL